MNSKNKKRSDSHRLLLNPTDKIKLKRSDKYISLSNLSICYTWKNINRSYKNNKFKIQHGLQNLNYMMDNIQSDIQ